MTARSDVAYPPDRPLVILMFGPLHRRVYWRDDIPSPIPYRDAGRFATKPLGELYAMGVPAPLRDRLPAVWEWMGTETSRPAVAPPAGGGFARACTYRGCLTPAAWAVAGNMERKPWLACDAHKDGMVRALAIGRTADYSVDPTPL